MLKVIELFSGIGTQTQALKNIGVEHEVVAIAEIDPFAIQAYTLLHGKPKLNLGDVSEIDPNTVPDHDLLTYSFPCFVEGTMVLTNEGYKPIETIREGDFVMTHENRFRKVVKPMINQADHLIKVSTMASDDLFTTEEHPFYVRERKYRWENSIRRTVRYFEEPKWVNASDLSRNYYVGTPVNTNSTLPSPFEGLPFEENSFWWVVGRYIGDGWLRHQGGIIICCAKDELGEITPHLDALKFNYSVVEERTAYKIHIAKKAIGTYMEQFGRGASNKRVTQDILDLPEDKLSAFLDGYCSADGWIQPKDNLHKISSVSRELIYGIGQCVAKAYKRPFSVYKTIRAKTAVIEGRLVNQMDSFSICYKKEDGLQDKAFFEDGYIWSPVNSIERIDEVETLVYNMEVEEDNSYVVQNIIVHNCTDISVAGAQEGLDEGSGTRSSTLWECEKIIDAKRPEFLLMENVKNLVGRTHLDNFHKWLKKLSNLGYTSYYAILNAKDFDVPQNRERVFVVSIQGERTTDYIFPEGVTLTKCVKDILEDEVPENMYMTQRLEFSANYKNTAIVSNELNMVGMLDMRGNESIRRVYHPGGLCPTLTTMTGGHRQPKFLVENRVRKATPRECWRLMGFSDEQFDLVAGKLSNAQLYKLAGNAIVVPVLEGIFTNLFKADS